VRLLAALVLPPLLALGIVFGAMRLVGGPPSSPHERAQGVVWGKRTFVNRAAFARWLNSRGRSYLVWARRHPVRPKVAPSKGSRPSAHDSSSTGSTVAFGGFALFAVAALAFLLRRRRPPLRRLTGLVRRPSLPRPRPGPSYARAHSATLAAWRHHPDLAWYLAGGALVAGAALVVAGLR
jgi:MYXO-CTERM domain-containing protein